MNRIEAKKLLEKSFNDSNRTLNLGILLKDAIAREDDKSIKWINEELKSREVEQSKKEG